MQFPKHIPFVEKLGCELQRFADGEAEIAIGIEDDLCNSWGVAHGGVVMTLLDVTMAHAARAPLSDPASQPPAAGTGVATIEMKTSFMRPGTGRLRCRAHVLHRTAGTAFCEGEIRDEKDALVAHATGTFKLLNGLPAGGRRIERPGASD